MRKRTTEVIAAVCGECATSYDAHWLPDFCGTCGCINGPWALVHLDIQEDGTSEIRPEYVGAWSREAQRQMGAHFSRAPGT